MTVSTVSAVVVKQATRHECAIGDRYPHTSGDGMPKRRTCAYCRGRIRTEAGTWGVYEWTGTNRYPLADAKRTFGRMRAAEEFATSNGLVVRWTYTG